MICFHNWSWVGKGFLPKLHHWPPNTPTTYAHISLQSSWSLTQIPLSHLFHAVHGVSKTLTYSGSHLKNTTSWHTPFSKTDIPFLCRPDKRRKPGPCASVLNRSLWLASCLSMQLKLWGFPWLASFFSKIVLSYHLERILQLHTADLKDKRNNNSLAL